MSYHRAMRLISAGEDGPASEGDLIWEPGEEEIEEWVRASGAEHIGFFEPDLVPSGTPSFRVPGPLHRHLASFPMHHIDCGGASVHIVADDGEAVVWVEDWLSGCLPSPFTDEGFGYGNPIVSEYIEEAVDKTVSRIGAALGQGWRLETLQPDADGDKPASRAIWVK